MSDREDSAAPEECEAPCRICDKVEPDPANPEALVLIAHDRPIDEREPDQVDGVHESRRQERCAKESRDGEAGGADAGAAPLRYRKREARNQKGEDAALHVVVVMSVVVELIAQSGRCRRPRAGMRPK